MDQSNVTNRPSKKNGKGKEKESQDYAAAENASNPGDNPTAMGGYLAIDDAARGANSM